MSSIKHCVFIEFKAEFNIQQRLDILQKLAALKPLIPGFIAMDYGQNLDLENKSNCNAGFTIDFENQAALALYSQHPQHQKLGAQLVSMSVNGAEGIMVYDLLG
ncbi:MAG: Dabb family protein [Oceanospirillaceae bacterium]